MREVAQAQHRRQWAQLLTLTAAHFIVDCFVGLMHTVLPAFQKSFQLTVASGAVLLTVLLVSANGIQVLIGHLRAEEDRPLFLYVGMLLVCIIILFGVVPVGPMALLWLSMISVVCGLGVGMTHPEGLKAIHRLDRISSAVSSAVFMAGGVMGFAGGSWISTYLFQWWGFASLIPFCVVSLLVLFAMMDLRIRLAVERDEPNRQGREAQGESISFWVILTIATLAVISMQVLAWIIPQRISELGVDLTAGGAAVSIFFLAGGVGGIVMAKAAERRGELLTICWMLLLGGLFTIAYLFLMRHNGSVVLLSIGGFFCFGSYSIMVAMARHGRELTLGGRMGLIVGGVWGIACLFPMLLGPVAESFGTRVVMLCSPIGFFLSLGLAVWQVAKQNKQKRITG